MRGLPFPTTYFLSLCTFFVFFNIFFTVLQVQAMTLEQEIAQVHRQMNKVQRNITVIQNGFSVDGITDEGKRRLNIVLTREKSKLNDLQLNLDALEEVAQARAAAQEGFNIHNVEAPGGNNPNGIVSEEQLLEYKARQETINQNQITQEMINQQQIEITINNSSNNGLSPEGEEEARRVIREANEIAEEDIRKRQEQIRQQAAAACHSSYGFASQIACNASLFSPVLIGLIQAFNNADTEGDIQAACKATKKHNGQALLVALPSYIICLKGLNSCISKCNQAAQLGDFSAQQKSGECSQKRTTISLVAIPTMIANTRRVFATKCPGEEEEEEEDNYYCQRYERDLVECKKNKPASDQACIDIQTQLSECNARQEQVACAGMTGAELQECLAFEEPAGPGTAGVTPPPGVRTPKKNPLPLDSIAANQFNPDDLLDGLDENGEEDIPIEPQGFDGNEDLPTNNPSPLGANANPGGGGGSLGGGGIGGFLGGAGGAGEDEQGEEGPYEEEIDPGIETDILGDASNARGGSSGFGSGQGGAQGFGFKGNNLKGFALPKNLFGDKKGKAGRSMAGIGGANEITSANGLSNFQKVSRAMNQRRQTEFK